MARLVDSARHLHDHGGSLKAARYAVPSVQHRFRELRGNLKIPWDSVASWQLGVAGRHRVPLPEEVLEAVSSLCFLLVLEFVKN